MILERNSWQFNVFDTYKTRQCVYLNMISRFMHCPSSHHLGAAKRILEYICETMGLDIDYHKVQNLIGYSDND